MTTLTETTWAYGFPFKVIYDRSNPHYIIKNFNFARDSRDIKIALQSFWKTRQYDFLSKSYKFSRSKKSQYREWAAKVLLYRQKQLDEASITIHNKRSVWKRVFYCACSWFLE